MIEIPITLGTAFFNQGFVNIPIAHNLIFGEHNAHLEVFLRTRNIAPIDSWINRTANPNHTPRIMMGINYTNWVQANHNMDEIIIVTVDDNFPNSILIQ